MRIRCASVVALLGIGSIVIAASHSDAPLIKQDPQANITDVYAFIGNRFADPVRRMLNVIVQVRPFSEPGDGPHYERFADDARYSIHITHPRTGDTVIRYDFLFSAVDAGLKNRNTILSYGLGVQVGPIQDVDDARQNFTQAYEVYRTVGNQTRLIGRNLVVAPPNAGKNVTPFYNDADGRAVSGASDFASLDKYTQQTIFPLGTGEVAFAGPRDDGFFADVPGVFDLLNVRILDNNGSLADGLGQDGDGVDGFKGFNVLSIAMQIPVDGLPTSTFNTPFFGEQTGVGVYASVSRRAVRRLSPSGARSEEGPWVQVNRMGNPLFNEVLVALKDKDEYNRKSPVFDTVFFATYARNPEVAALINAVYGTNFASTGRNDLVAVFVPDVLRVVTTTGPVRLAGEAGFSRLGFIGGDTTDGVSGGWPNGRRLGDDVVDIALTAVASGPMYSAITLVGDNVASNDVVYNQVFPYSATPHSGTNNRKDP